MTQQDLQAAYDLGPPVGSGISTVILDATRGGIVIADNPAPIGADLVSVFDSVGSPLVRVRDGEFELDIPVVINDVSADSQNAITYGPTFTQTAAFIGGLFLDSGTVTISNSVFIWGNFQERRVFLQSSAPSFAAYTHAGIIPVMRSSSAVNQLSALCFQAAPSYEKTNAGTATAATITGLSFTPQLRPTITGATQAATSITAVQCQPAYSTVAGSTASFGTIIGLNCLNPAVGLFQPSAGVENMTAYIGVDVQAIPFGGNVTKVGLRSALVAASNTRMIQNTSNAASDFGAGLIHLNDAIPLALGGSVAVRDVDLSWNGVANALEFTFVSGSGNDLRINNPSADRFLFDTDGGNTVAEYNWNCHKFSLGAQTGAVGNQVGVFVAGTRAVAVGGEWTDFLLTQAGNITVNAAMSLVAGWTINAPSITLGTGSVTTGCGLNIGGNPNQGTNRVGVRILSNPTGGGGVNAALWVTAGRSQFDGFVDINKPVALGGGATATLGTIAGSGPTTAAQAQWVEIEINGVRHWLPAWT